MPTARISKVPDHVQELVPGVPDVAQVIRAAPQGQGTINAEGGETIVGDVNRDSLLEFMRINGPSHAQGGVELDVDPGSFVFSDSKRLRVKDPEILAKFTKGASKKGLTPAAISKQYDLNSHVQVLKDESSDAIAKQTAQLMLDTQSKKLAELSLVQEGLKGFPNGIPTLAQQLLPEVAENYQEILETAGTREFAFGGETGGDTTRVQPLRNQNTPWQTTTTEPAPTAASGSAPLPKAGSKLYLNDKAIEVKSVDVNALSSNPRAAYITLSNGAQLTRQQWQQVHSDKPLTMRFETSWPGNPTGGYAPVTGSDKRHSVGSVTGIPQLYSNKPQQVRRTFGKDFNVGKGDQLTVNDTAYEVLDPHGEYAQDYTDSWKSWRDVFDDTKGIIKAKNKKTGEIEYLEGEDVLQARRNAPEYFRHVDARSLVKPKAKPAPVAPPTAEQAAYASPPPGDGGDWQDAADPSELAWGPGGSGSWQPAAPARKAHTPPQVVHTRPKPQPAPAAVPTQSPAQRAAQQAAPAPTSKASAFFDSL